MHRDMSEQLPHDDRRRFRRMQARFLVVYKVKEPLEVTITINKREISALMLDLSEGGMALVTECDIPEKTVLVMNFTLINTAMRDDSRRIRSMDMEGVVKYNLSLEGKEHRLGIAFTRLKEDDRDAVRDFVTLSQDSFRAS